MDFLSGSEVICIIFKVILDLFACKRNTPTVLVCAETEVNSGDFGLYLTSSVDPKQECPPIYFFIDSLTLSQMTSIINAHRSNGLCSQLQSSVYTLAYKKVGQG